MANLATAVNDKKRQEEEATGLFDAYEQTKHCPPTLISHRRRLILTADVVCTKTNRPIRLTLCSDLLMVSLVLAKTVLSQLTGSQTEHGYRFLRWLDLLELDVADTNAIKPNTIRFTHLGNPISTRISNSTPDSEIPPVSKEIGSKSFSCQFVGFDASKSRDSFLKAIETVTKKCRDDLLDEK
jgi:hypothetical protein